MHSLSFDMVPKSEIITLNRLHSIKLKANSTKHKLVKLVVDLSNPRKLPLEEITEAKSEGGMKLYRVQVGLGSSLIIGTYGDKDTTICFISFHILYIDLLMQITELSSILNLKYCDIDSTFGLHDYTITIDIRNSKQSFICEIFRKVFTKELV